MINWGAIPVGTVIPFPFAAFGTNGESLTLSGLAVTDIEVYGGVSMTQRASDAGFALMDTDGIDIDGRTGIHGFSIDTSDNTDAGFYAAGSLYWVVVDAVTINSQTVRFLAGTFRLVPAETTAGIPKVDASLIEGSDATNQIRDAVVDDATRIDASALNTLSGHDPGEAIMGATDLGTGAGLTSLATQTSVDTIDNLLDTEVAAIKTVVDAIQAKTDNLPSDPADQSLVIAATNALAALIGTPAVTLADDIGALPTNAELSTALGTADDAVLAAIAALNNLSAAQVNAEVDTAISDAALATAANLATVDTVVDAIKVQTDKLTFTVANQLDANVQSINDVAITGDGQVGTEFGV